MDSPPLQDLLKTHNLIDLYVHAQGQSEVPSELHRWAMMSLIAATVRDQIWIDKIGKLYPNLYVLLIMPSGIGKGVAINPVNKLADARGMEVVNVRRIKVTGQALVDLISKAVERDAVHRPNKVYMLTPELSNSLGGKETATGLIKMMTDLYDATDYTVEEHTRTSGFHKLRNVCINWLGGSTKEWLMSSLDMADVLSGFTARTICVQPEYDPSVRFTRPIYPDNRTEILQYIEARLVGLTRLGLRKGRTGEFKRTPEMQAAEEQWYMTREAVPQNSPLFPSWRREHDQVLKLSMNFAMASEDHWHKYIVTVDDFRAAISAMEDIIAKLPLLLNYAIASPQSQLVERAISILEQHNGRMPHSALLSMLRVDAFNFANIVNTLLQRNEIRAETNTRRQEEIYILRKHEVDFRVTKIK